MGKLVSLNERQKEKKAFFFILISSKYVDVYKKAKNSLQRTIFYENQYMRVVHITQNIPAILLKCSVLYGSYFQTRIEK